MAATNPRTKMIITVLVILVVFLAGVTSYALVNPRTVTVTSTITGSTTVSSVSTSSPVTIRLAHSIANQSDFLPIYLAMDLGVFKSLGINIQEAVLPGDTGTTAMLAGNVDVSINGDPVLVPALKGANIIILGYYSQAVAFGNLVARLGITNLTQLNGKLIASERPGSATYIWVSQILQYYHINATQVPFDSSSLRTAALLAGKVDAVAANVANAVQLVDKGYNLLISGGGPYAYPSEYIATTSSYLQSNKKDLVSFMLGVMRGVAMMETLPNATIPVIMRHYNLTASQAERYYKSVLSWHTNNPMLSAIEARANVLIPLNHITNPVPVRNFVNLDVYKQAVNIGL